MGKLATKRRSEKQHKRVKAAKQERLHVPAPGNKSRFEQLLDDAVFGTVKKK